MTLDLFSQMPISSHRYEKSEEGTTQVQKLHSQFTKGCTALLKFWQRPNGNFWLSNEDARDLKISSYASARIFDLQKCGVPIEKKQDGNIKRFRLKCTCTHVGGQPIVTTCYLHNPELKVK